jgi:hypothetical protein
VDKGADLCMYPRSILRGPANKDAYEMFAANGTRTATYGIALVSLDCPLIEIFKWRFVIADVTTPIIDVDFLSHYGLLVDPENRHLIDQTTNLSSVGYRAEAETAAVKTIIGESTCHRLLAKYPDLTRPPFFRRETIRHNVEHHIETTPGPLVHYKLRRLAPNSLKRVKSAFEMMME